MVPSKRIIKEAGELWNKGTSGDHPNYYNIEISQKYWEEPWRSGETCCNSHSCERPSTNADHGIKLKECEKKDKFLDLAWELKNLVNMKVTIIPIVIGAFLTVTKGFLKGLEDLEVGGRVETINTTSLLKSIRIPRRVLENWRDLQSLKLQWKTIS